MTYPTCKTCKWWDRRGFYWTGEIIVRRCAHALAQFDDNELHPIPKEMEATTEYGCALAVEGGLATSDSYGCIHHEEEG